MLPVSPENRTPGHRFLTAETQVTTGQLQITLNSFLGLCTEYSQVDRSWLGCVTLQGPLWETAIQTFQFDDRVPLLIAVGQGWIPHLDAWI